MYEELHKEQYKNYLKEKYTLAQKIIDEVLKDKRSEKPKSLVYNITKLPEELQSTYSGKVAEYIQKKQFEYDRANTYTILMKNRKKTYILLLITAITSTILTTIFINLI